MSMEMDLNVLLPKKMLKKRITRPTASQGKIRRRIRLRGIEVVAVKACCQSWDSSEDALALSADGTYQDHQQIMVLKWMI